MASLPHLLLPDVVELLADLADQRTGGFGIGGSQRLTLPQPMPGDQQRGLHTPVEQLGDLAPLPLLGGGDEAAGTLQLVDLLTEGLREVGILEGQGGLAGEGLAGALLRL